MRHIPTLALILVTLVRPAAAAPRYNVEKLAEGVHAVIYNPDVDVEGNTLIVVNDRDVFVVDANAGAATARDTISEIRKITPKPVTYVVNTHWHDDHHMGNQAYADAYPGVKFVAHPLTRKDIVDHTVASNAFVLDLIEADIARLSGYLETGVGRDGRKVEGEYQTRVETVLANRRQALEDRRQYRPVVPTVDVADSMTLERGGREIQIRFLGRGNTRGDLVVYLPRERILATGDLVVAPVPYATNVYARDWVRTLDRMMAMPATTVLPGHGPVMRDWTYVRQVKNALEQTIAGVAAAKKEGLSIAQTSERVQLPDIRESFVQGIETRRAGYEAFFRPTLIRNAWEELDPEIMKAYAASSMKKVAPNVYRFGVVTITLNEKDITLENPPPTAPAARAAVRAIRELTDKDVRMIVAPAESAGLDVFRETYKNATVAPRVSAAGRRGNRVVWQP